MTEAYSPSETQGSANNKSQLPAVIPPIIPQASAGQLLNNPPNTIVSDRYRIVRFRDAGAWGEVWEAEDTLLKRLVALKKLSPSELALQQARLRGKDLDTVLQEEAMLIPPGNYQHLVSRSFEYDLQGKPFLTMNLYDSFFSQVIGDNLPVAQRRTLGHGLSLDDVFNYTHQILQAVREFHDATGKAHADIKPGNIAVDVVPSTKAVLVYLTDFGAATSSSPSQFSGLARHGIGEPLTRAPQNFFEGTHPTTESDLFSVGALLYRMVVGTYPFEDVITKASKEAMSAQTVQDANAVLSRAMEPFVRRYVHSSEHTDKVTWGYASDGVLNNSWIPLDSIHVSGFPHCTGEEAFRTASLDHRLVLPFKENIATRAKKELSEEGDIPQHVREFTVKLLTGGFSSAGDAELRVEKFKEWEVARRVRDDQERQHREEEPRFREQKLQRELERRKDIGKLGRFWEDYHRAIKITGAVSSLIGLGYLLGRCAGQ